MSYILHQQYKQSKNMKDSKFCEFCEILYRKDQRGTEIIAQNQQFFAFHDLDNASAVAHVLVCTKEHIQSALHVKEPSQLIRMKSFATSVLTDLHTTFMGKNNKIPNFRFGFHVPPLISIYHIHLHSFILPFAGQIHQRYKYAYGPLFKSVEQMVELAMQRGRL